MSIILIIIWAIAAIYKLDYPVFSLNEISFIPSIILQYLAPHNWWLIRLISIGTILFVIYSLVKKFHLKTVPTLILVTTPWLFILARELNLWITGILIILTLMLVLNKKLWVYMLAIFFFAFMLYSHPITVQILKDKAQMLLSYASFIKLFFQMENESVYLHIPKIGYFPYFTLPLFIIGLTDTKIYRTVLPLFITGLIFYFLYPTIHFIFAGVGILFVIEWIILSAATNIKFIYIKAALILLLIGNFIFFSEIYFRHFHKLYGGERGYNEFNLINQIFKPEIQTAYIPSRDDLKMLVYYYSKSYKSPSVIYWNDVKTISKTECEKKEVLCVFTESELNRIDTNKDDSELKPFTDPAGLKIYYSL